MAWEERYITSRFGAARGPVKQPRLIAYQADDASLGYSYSGDTLMPQPWSAPVLRVKVTSARLAAPHAQPRPWAALQRPACNCCGEPVHAVVAWWHNTQGGVWTWSGSRLQGQASMQGCRAPTDTAIKP